MMNNKEQMHPEDRKNLITFVLVALSVYYLYDHFILRPRIDALRAEQFVVSETIESTEPGKLAGTVEASLLETERPRETIIAESPRLLIDNEAVFGSIALKGGRIDDLSLSNYYQTLEKKDHVVLLAPAGSPHPEYIEFGWISANKEIKVPDRNTLWRIRRDSPDNMLTVGHPVTLFWDNGQGLLFERTLEIDSNYLIKVTQKLVNNSTREVTLFPYSLLSRHGYRADYGYRWIIHEGPIGYFGDELVEVSYKKMPKKPDQSFQATKGWIGISEKYWFSSLIPEQGKDSKYRLVYTEPKSEQDKPRFQVDIMGASQTIAPGKTIETKMNLFVGAKDLNLLEAYEKELGIPHFDLAVDFGLYYFMTKPFFYILNFFGGLLGNFGLAIICLTVIIRAAVFPLASTSFRSFAKMKEISPQMKELREKYGDDKTKLQEELVKLYEKKKVNPMAGCFPILIQIPIFFALFKTLSVTLEMRHAPFFGWIQDLSAPDMTSVFNLFGLLPYDVPSPLMIGVWPCTMLFFMILQKRLNPPPQDPTQAMIANYMPYFITYILSQFAAGLVIYWTFSNALSVLQQYVIMRSMGVEVHLFKRSKSEKEMEEMVKEGPAVHPGLGVIEDEIEEALYGEAAEDKKPMTPPKPKKKRKKK